jgi:hypothetical protein
MSLAEIDEEPREPSLEYDREVDLVGFTNQADTTSTEATPINSSMSFQPSWPIQHAQIRSLSAFELLAPQGFDPPDPAHPHAFFCLPQHIRHKIYGMLFPQETRKISLSPRFAIKIYGEGYFATPWDIIGQVYGVFEACAFFRGDCLVYFWTEYHFHVTIHAFSGPKFSPLSHCWLPHYLGIIQRLTVEIDFTKLGGSRLNAAPDFGYRMTKEGAFVRDLVGGLKIRDNGLSIAEFNVMCRRYVGVGPDSALNYTGGELASYQFKS